MRGRLWLAAVCACALLGGACAGGEAVGEETVTTAARVQMPSKVLGLDVVTEDITGQLEEIRASYFDAVGLYSFRRDDNLLRATLQVGRFGPLADPDDPEFRAQVIGNLGATVPEEIRVGDETVFLTAGNEQNIFAWLEDDALLVLSIRNDYPFPRTLLRRLAEADLVR